MMKKVFLLSLVAILWIYATQQSNATIAFVNGSRTAEISGSATSVTSTLNVTSGNLLVAGCRYSATTGTSSVQDTIGNSWTLAKNNSHSTVGSQFFWYAISTGSNATDTITCNFSASVSFRSALNSQFSGVASVSPLDFANASSGSSAANMFSDPFSTAQANEVVIGLGDSGSSGITYTAGPGGYVVGVGATGSGDQGLEYLITTTPLVNATTSLKQSSNAIWNFIVAAFKPTIVVTGPLPPPKTKIILVNW